jgi:perosamine synthetase
MIPLAIPNLFNEEKKNLIDTFNSTWISTAGEKVKKFELKFKKLIGSNYAIACNSGTSALHIAIKLAGVKSDDEVIVPSLTFAATANAIIYNQAKPIFFNCDKYLNINIKDVEDFIKKNTYFKNGKTINKKTGKKISAIIPVHMYGNASDIFKIQNLLRNRKITIIEDAAESLGTKYLQSIYKSKFTGTIGSLGVFSFNANKIITSGSGGMIITNNSKLAERAKLITNQAKKSEFEYIHEEVGYNYRMNNLCASIGISQLSKLSLFLSKKKKIFEFYQKEFMNNKLIKMINAPIYAKNNYWMPLIKIDLKKISFSKKKIIDELQKRNIQIRGCWDPLHNQIPYKKFQNYNIKNLNNIAQNIFCLPCSTQISFKELKYVSKNLQKLVS